MKYGFFATEKDIRPWLIRNLKAIGAKFDKIERWFEDHDREAVERHARLEETNALVRAFDERLKALEGCLESPGPR